MRHSLHNRMSHFLTIIPPTFLGVCVCLIQPVSLENLTNTAGKISKLRFVIVQYEESKKILSFNLEKTGE